MDNYTKEEFEVVSRELLLFLSENENDCKNRKAFLLGGQPGAGKSGLTTLIKEENKVIEINGDEFRKTHPRYQELKKKYGDDYVLHTQNFIANMTESLITNLSNEGFSLVIEGTLRTVEAPLKTCELLKKKGYQVDLNLVLVKPEISLLGTFQRYEKMFDVGTVARKTPVEHHDSVVTNIADNLDILKEKELFDNIEIYNRNGERLYSLRHDQTINPGNIFRKEFARNFSEEEINFINKSCEYILTSMTKRNANEKQIEDVKKRINIIQDKIKFQQRNRHNVTHYMKM